MWVLFAFLFLLFLLLWLRVEVEIDTEKQIFAAKWKGIIGFRMLPTEERWRWFFKLFFWEREWKPGTKKSPEKEIVKKEPSGKKGKMPFSPRQLLAIFRNVMRAIRVERLRVNWDTGDFVLNAWLYPFFQTTNRGRRQLSINFSGQQELSIRLYTRLGLLAMAGVRVFFTLKK